MDQNNLKKIIYFDNAATTLLHPNYVKIKSKLYKKYGYYNINTSSYKAQEIHSSLEKAKIAFLDLLKLNYSDYNLRIVNGATEANKAIINYYCKRGLVYISNYEHPSIYNIKDKNIRKIPIKDDGNYEIDYLELYKIIEKNKDKISLVSVMAANNEIPVFNDLKKIRQLCSKYNIPFHSDISQAFCKSKTRFFDADILSLTLHKVMCDKGFGLIIYKRDDIDREELISLTVDQTLDPIPFIGATYFIESIIDDLDHSSQYTDYLYNCLEKKGVRFKFIRPKDIKKRNEHLILVSLTGKCSIKLKKYLDKEGIIVSIGSACSTKNAKSSHVIHNANLSHNKGILRVSFPSTDEEKMVKTNIKQFVEQLIKILPYCDYENK